MKLRLSLLTSIAIICCLLFGSAADLTAAKYAGEPFYLGVGAHALAMGGAYGSAALDVSAGFWNPAGLTGVGIRQFAFMHSETFGSLLNHDYLAFAMPIDSVSKKTVAFTLTRLGGGGVKITEWDLETNRPRIIREESHADYQFLLSYAFRYNEQFDFGASAKFIYRDIPTSSAYGQGADIGARYYPGNWLTFSLMVRDLTTTLLAYGNGTKESIYPTLTPGFMLFKAWDDISIRITGEGDIRFENLKDAAEFWMGSTSLDTHWGIEAGYRNTIFARGGVDIGKLALGGGLKVFPFQIDFAYLKHNDLDDSFRVSALFFWK